MEKKTHVAVGNFLSLSILQPTSITGLLVTIGSSTLGSLISDVDLKDSDIDKLFDKLMTILCSVVITCLVLNYIFDLGLYEKIRALDGFVNYVLSVGIFIVISFLASKTPHRSYTHSIIGVVVFVYILNIGFNNDVIYPFLISIISHIGLDFLNKTGIEIFYPFQWRLSLKFFESSGIVNKILLYLFSILDVLAISILLLK